MIKIFQFLILIFFATSAFAKQEPYPGQFVYGNIGPYGLDTEILLPPGEWIVAGVSTSNGGIRWTEIILLQTESKKIKALLNIKYPRQLEKPINEWGIVMMDGVGINMLKIILVMITIIRSQTFMK